MYSKNSPYAKTYVVGDYLDIMSPRSVIHDTNDETYTIESQYHMRPDLLAYNKYGLNNPATYRSRYRLDGAVKSFERDTGLIWPFK